jgi:flagellar biosynthesis/type III secretory pathway protein FliH
VGRILKAAGAPAPGTAGDRARVLAEAEAEARAVVARAREEAARLRSEAVEQGRQEGIRVAAAGREDLEIERERLETERERLLDRAEEEIVHLALAVAGKVLALAVQDERAVVESARRALARVRGRKELVARVHPADVPALRAEGPGLLPGATRAERLEIRQDPGVGRGGVILETEAGTVDARIEAQLEALGQALLEEE